MRGAEGRQVPEHELTRKQVSWPANRVWRGRQHTDGHEELMMMQALRKCHSSVQRQHRKSNIVHHERATFCGPLLLYGRIFHTDEPCQPFPDLLPILRQLQHGQPFFNGCCDQVRPLLARGSSSSNSYSHQSWPVSRTPHHSQNG